MSRQAKPRARKSNPKAAPTTPAVVRGTDIKITAAKGRPMLVWVGKRPLTHVTVFPAQHVETFDPAGTFERPPITPDIWKDWPSAYPLGGLLFHGDNKEVLAHLLANGFRGKVHLVYIDPPFDSGADYVRKVSLRGAKGTAKLDGESYSLGEQIQYPDIWANDNYLQFMYERLLLLKELLSDQGSIYLHCDSRRNAMLRSIMDEVFGEDNFQNEIVWERTNAHNIPTKTFMRAHDTLLFYSKTDRFAFNKARESYSPEQIKRYKPDRTGRLYTGQDLTYSGANQERQFVWRGAKPPPNRSWGFSMEELERLWAEGRILTKKDGTPRLDGLRVYFDEAKGKPITTIWTDVERVGNTSAERLDYPTQKPKSLVDRIVRASSRPGDIILDCFIGSGTTAEVAQLLGRRWIACDINKGAIQTTSRRLQTIPKEQSEAAERGAREEIHSRLIEDLENTKEQSSEPTQFAFTVWRVNDYDLQIQHNEAVNLACEHIGIERTRTDPYFDGTLGRSLAKIIPFGHPLTPLDLEELKRELDARPDEDRPITLVCLGIELAAKAWIDDWNRLRKGRNAVNRVEVIELRTDPRYGKFIKHEPARAKVKVTRRNGTLTVEIEDFISPTIIERLQQQAGLLQPKIDDWRAMVDCLMIDPAYDGKVFNIAISDVPERKSDLVAGKYELSAPKVKTTVAVKIIDMLGEEVLTVHTV